MDRIECLRKELEFLITRSGHLNYEMKYLFFVQNINLINRLLNSRYLHRILESRRPLLNSMRAS
jgi:hypothetical protein